MVALKRSVLVLGVQRTRDPSDRSSSKAFDVASKRTGDVVILTMNVVGNGTSHRDKLRSRRGRQKPPLWAQ